VQTENVVETERLALRRLSLDDAEFIMELVNQPSFLRFIGDKNVRNREDAVRYLQTGPMASYEQFGFGPYLVTLKETDECAGMAGLLKRETLPAPDIGFAFLPQYWSKGLAYEAAQAVIKLGRESFAMKQIVAITSPDNEASMKLLERLGFKYARMIKLTEDQPEVRFFELNL
jgi:[ribosomal protein S5]-alanine N-acetyltransferase